MDPKRWDRVHELLAEALERPPEARSSYLAEACPDARLRREVETLLAQDSAVLSRLERPPLPLLDTSVELASGHAIGPYRVVGELGRGGMGVVYLAERADDEFERRVAVKVLKRGLDTAEIVARFRTERQILANLEHPYIAELYEGGTTGDGLPYFVMEHVEGERIDRYCDERRLAIRDRLELFGKVCEAVRFAHRNLVVHRDLKPGNILVTAEGEPRLLDFGIAKLLDPQTREGVTLTAAGVRPMTPEYASPEQVTAGPITTATDVYALGVLLYELLSGHRPCRVVSGSSPEELRRAICEEEPEKPSTMITRPAQRRGRDGSALTLTPEALSQARGEEPKRLRRRLRGDLDNIVLMALGKEPERRYPSVDAFVEDLERYQDGLPVRARKATLAYRAGKLIRRRCKEVAVGVVLVGLGVGFAADRLEQQRGIALERDKAQRISRFLVDLFGFSDPYRREQGQHVTAREILDQGARQIALESNLEPEIRGALMQTIGEIYLKLGVYSEAQRLLEEALDQRRRDGDESPEIAENLSALASLRYEQGDYESAEKIYGEVLEMVRRRYGDVHSEIAKALNGLALVVQGRGELDRAEVLHREALEMQQLLGPNSADFAQTLNDLAVLLLRRDQLEAAEELLRQAVEIERRHFGPRHPRIEAVLSNLASVLLRQRRDEEARELFHEALDIARQAYGSGHPSVARILNSLGYIAEVSGRLEEAEGFYREALEIARSAYGEQHPNVARTMNGLAGVLREQGDFATAEELLRRSLAIQVETLGPEHSAVASVAALLAILLLAKGEPAAAEPVARRAVDIFRQTLPPEHGHIFVAEKVLGTSLVRLGRFDEAEPLLLRSYLHIKEVRGAEVSETYEALERVIELYEAWGRPEQAAGYRARRKVATTDDK